MAKPSQPQKPQVRNEHGMYPTIHATPKTLTQQKLGQIQANIDGLKDFDAETMAMLRYASYVESTCQDKGILDNARHLKTAITLELPRLMASGDLTAVLALTLMIGRLYERIFAVINYEPNVKQVRTTTKKLRDGFAREKAHPSDTIIAAIGLYKSLLEKSPKRKKSAVESEVKKHTGVAPRTLRYHLAKTK